jgi:hypothetical protein
MPDNDVVAPNALVVESKHRTIDVIFMRARINVREFCNRQRKSLSTQHATNAQTPTSINQSIRRLSQCGGRHPFHPVRVVRFIGDPQWRGTNRRVVARAVVAQSERVVADLFVVVLLSHEKTWREEEKK